jgi:hypothetical protein
MGLRPGKNVRASVSLTTTTRGAPGTSRSVRSRPERSGVPSVLNQPGEIRFPNNRP